MQTPKANINPAMLTFSRERMGYDIPVIARKVAVNEERWIKWEQGADRPTMNQLIKIAEQLDRTPAFYYLDELPKRKNHFLNSGRLIILLWIQFLPN